jgi:SAM-dependent methyltransferase
MARRRKLVILAGGAAEAIAVLRHGRRATRRHRVPGGILIGDAVVYDALSRLLLGSLVERIAADTATVAPDGARVLEVGCGPGHLSTRLAHHHGFDVTGLDLDPAMIARAQANADRPRNGDQRRPSFLVGNVASLAFPDGSFDLVVSTLSMHHWADPTAGLAEIGRVLRPGGRALIWDFRPGVRPHLFGPRHVHIPDPLHHTRSSPLRVVNATPWPWPWPWRFNLTQRMELVRADGSPPGPQGPKTPSGIPWASAACRSSWPSWQANGSALPSYIGRESPSHDGPARSSQPGRSATP